LQERTIELRQLRYFVRIVDLGSLSRAAGVLHVAQSALSHQVAALETELKSTLLNRNSRGVSATEAGQHLYRHAQAILKQADDARDAVLSCSSAPSGQVGLGLPLSLAPSFALPIFNELRVRYPAIRLQLYEALSGTILEWLKSGRLTLGVVFDEGNLEGLDCVRVMEERLFLVVHPRSALARRKLVTLRELQGIELMLPDRDHGVRQCVERAMLKEGLAPPTVMADMNSLTLMKQAVAANLAATVLPWSGVEAELQGRQLVALEIARPAITRVAAVCASAATPHSRAADCALNAAVLAIRATLRQAAWRGLRSLATPA